MTDTKHVRETRALTVVSALVDRGLVDATRQEEALDVVDRSLAAQQDRPASLRQRFVELAGYVGGAFVVSAAAIFFADRWDGLSVGQQVALLAGVALLLAVAGIAVPALGDGFPAVRSGGQPVLRRLTGVLLTGAAAMTAFAVGLQVETSLSDTDSGEAAGLAAGLTVILVAAVGYRIAPTVLGQLAIVVGALTAIPSGLSLLGGPSGGEVAVGLSLLALGVAWLLLAERGFWVETASARVIGCAVALVGAQFPVLGSDHEAAAYVATALLAAAAFWVYVARTAWPYLATGVAAVTLVVPEALMDWSEGNLGPAGVLLVAGVTLLVACLVGLRLRKEVTTA